MNLGIIHTKISEICPILGISGSLSDIPNLRIDFAPEASDEQKQAALDLLQNWNDSVLPNPELFMDTLKNSPDFPLEFMPYLAAWSYADLLNDVSRKQFWAKVKNSKQVYFLTPEIIQAVENLALSCNLPLE